MQEYIVVKSGTLNELVKQVNLNIAKGYHIIGGISCMVNYYNVETYVQAMVK